MRGVPRLLFAPARSLPLEILLVAATIVAWELVRIPLEGSAATSLAHADDWLALEHALHLDWERAFQGWAASVEPEALRWIYLNAHLPAIFAFLAWARVAAPQRYPFLRATFVLSHVPAALAIGLYPLAPPDWLARFGFAPPETLTSGVDAILKNSTAAVASQHFGYTLFIAVAAVWLCRGALASWTTAAYPALVFFVIVGMAEHYVLDAVVGGACFALAAVVAAQVAQCHKEPFAPETPRPLALATGTALTTWGIVEFPVLGGSDLLLPTLAILAGMTMAVVELRPRGAVEETV
jgi:hypothetical protein